MPTDCTPAQFEFPRPKGRAVVASFAGGRITTDAGALLPGAADRVIGLLQGHAPRTVRGTQCADAGDPAGGWHCAGL